MFSRKRSFRTVLILTALVLAGVLFTTQSARAADIVIDDFTNTTLLTPLSRNTTGTTTFVDSPVTSAQGSVRDLSLTHSTGTGAVTLDVDSVLHYVAFASAPSTSGGFSVRWDGDSVGSSPSLNLDLGAVSGYDGFFLPIYADQVGWQMTINVTDPSGTTTASYSFTENQDIHTTGRVYYIPFSSFSNSNVFNAAVGAITFSVTGVSDLDLTLHDFLSGNFADGLVDMGDLPTNYALTTLVNSGAGHYKPGTTIQLQRTEGSVDTELDGQPDANAGHSITDGGDDNDGNDDEGGVVPVGLWNDSIFDVDVYASGVKGCLTGWLDYCGPVSLGANGDFNQLGEDFIVNEPIDPANNPTQFSLDLGFGFDLSNRTVFARFRIVPDRDGDGSCADQAPLTLNGLVDDGEVEDYKWTVLPTAVTLQSFEAANNTKGTIFGASLLVVVIFGFGLILHRRRKSIHQ